MAKSKNHTPKVPGSQKATFARLNFLYQAAALLAIPRPLSSITSPTPTPTTGPTPAGTAISHHLTSNLLQTSQKSVLRVAPSIKRTICKRCHAILIPGLTSSSRVENKSRKERKKKADVLVVECASCGAGKRFVVGEGREKKERVDKIKKKKAKNGGIQGEVKKERGKKKERKKERKVCNK